MPSTRRSTRAIGISPRRSTQPLRASASRSTSTVNASGATGSSGGTGPGAATTGTNGGSGPAWASAAKPSWRRRTSATSMSASRLSRLATVSRSIASRTLPSRTSDSADAIAVVTGVALLIALPDDRDMTVRVVRCGEEPRLDGVARARHALVCGGAVQEHVIEEQHVARGEVRPGDGCLTRELFDEAGSHRPIEVRTVRTRLDDVIEATRQDVEAGR